MKKENKIDIDKIVDAMQKLIVERKKAEYNLKGIDVAIRNLLQKNIHCDSKNNDLVDALLNIKQCKMFNEKHKVKIEEHFEENWHNGDLEREYQLICDKCKHDGRGCSCSNLGKYGKSIKHSIKEQIILDWLFDGEFKL